MATLVKRGKRWYVDYRENGRRIKKSMGTRKDLAEDFLKDLEAKRVHGDLMGIPQLKDANFDDFVKKYVKDYGPNKAATTLYRDSIAIDHFVAFFSHKPLKRITAGDIEEYKAQRRATRKKGKTLANGTVVEGNQISKSTINRELGLLKSILNRAVEWGYLKSNPADGIKKFKEDETEPQYLKPAEARKLLDMADGQMRVFIGIALNTGMRKSEILNLKWADVDVPARRNIVSKSKGKRFRAIPMNRSLLDILQKHPRHIKSPYVLYGAGGERRKSFQVGFESLRKQAGFNGLRIHDMRHTFISNLVMNGVDLRQVQELAGHRDIRTTMRYAHLNQEMLQDSVELLTWEEEPAETGS